MKRTTIMLPEELKTMARKRANIMGISLGSFIREAIKNSLLDTSLQKSGYDQDPFFTDSEIFTGKAPEDLSTDHDRYLYGDDN